MAFPLYFIKKEKKRKRNPSCYAMQEGGYSVTPNRRTDKDSYVNGKGELVRSMYPTKRSTIAIKILDGRLDRCRSHHSAIVFSESR